MNIPGAAASSIPFKRLHQFADVFAYIIDDRRQRIGIGTAVEIERTAEHAGYAVGELELDGRSRLSSYQEQRTENMLFGMVELLLLDVLQRLGIAFHQLTAFGISFFEIGRFELQKRAKENRSQRIIMNLEGRE